ncbi:MAG: glycoside hydrolase family 76 protein [Anaeromyxobacteraceae bacterium]
MRNGTHYLPRPTPTSSLPRLTTSSALVALAAPWFAALALTAVACGGGAAGALAPAVPPGAEVTSAVAPVAGDDHGAEAQRRADAATEALVDGFWSSDARAFTVTRGGAPAEYWIAAQAYDAVLDGVERSGGQRFTDVAKAFVAGQDARGWERDFFDDESWMALALIRASDLTGDGEALARAEALLEDIMTNGADPAGGVWWNRQHTQKATASNAGAVITAARLHERTGDARRLEFATSVFAHWLAEMVDPATGQVADHVEPSGEKVWWRFTYNEGAMIGAALALHRATHDVSYLEAARRIGSFMRSGETAATPSGAVLTDGPRCDGDCEEFKGIGARYLAELAEADPQGGWGDLVATSAGALWDLARDPATTTFGVDWAARSGAASVATQSAAATALGRAARLAANAGR